MPQPPTTRLARSFITLIIYVILQICIPHPLTQCCSCYPYTPFTRFVMLIDSPVKLTSCVSKSHPIDRNSNNRCSPKRPRKLTTLQRPPHKQTRPDQQTAFSSARNQHNTQPTRQHQDPQQVRILTPHETWMTCRKHRSAAAAPTRDALNWNKHRPAPALLRRGDKVSTKRHTAPRRPRMDNIRSGKPECTSKSRTQKTWSSNSLQQKKL